MSRSGRHHLQIPGPTNVPDEVVRAMAAPVIDHRGPEFAAMARDLLAALGPVFGTEAPVVVYPSSGTGAWEAALVNTMSPGDRVLCFDQGHFAGLWRGLAERIGLRVEVVPGDWRRAPDLEAMRARLHDDAGGTIKAVLVVHNETSTGVIASIPEVRRVLDEVGHPALLLVDAVSSLGAVEYEHDRWGVDVTIAGSQKGLMLPPGLGFNAVSERALAASATASMPRAYWDWSAVLRANEGGSWPYTPATTLLYGLRTALRMLDDEGIGNIARRHRRHGEAARAAVRGWGLETYPLLDEDSSPALTVVVIPPGHDADAVRRHILERFDMSLGTGLGPLAGTVFRIGHLGHFNDVSLAGVLAGVQMGLAEAGVPVNPDGVAHALAALSASTGVREDSLR